MEFLTLCELIPPARSEIFLIFRSILEKTQLTSRNNHPPICGLFCPGLGIAFSLGLSRTVGFASRFRIGLFQATRQSYERTTVQWQSHPKKSTRRQARSIAARANTTRMNMDGVNSLLATPNFLIVKTRSNQVLSLRCARTLFHPPDNFHPRGWTLSIPRTRSANSRSRSRSTDNFHP